MIAAPVEFVTRNKPAIGLPEDKISCWKSRDHNRRAVSSGIVDHQILVIGGDLNQRIFVFVI